MLIEIYFQIILVIVGSVLLSGLKIGDEVLDVFGVDENFVECRYDEDFSLYDRN